MTVRIQGLRRLERKLDALPTAVQGQVLKDALLEAAEPIRETASAKAPRRTGQLSREIVKEVVTDKRDDAEVGVGPSKAAWYGAMQELGNERHGAQPFLRPAFDTEKDRAVEIARRELGAAIEREARK